MYSCGPPHMYVQKQDDQHELTYSNYVRTQDVILKTCRRRWMIERNGERGSGISALAARHDDDDYKFILVTMTFIRWRFYICASNIIWTLLFCFRLYKEKNIFFQSRYLYMLILSVALFFYFRKFVNYNSNCQKKFSNLN